MIEISEVTNKLIKYSPILKVFVPIISQIFKTSNFSEESKILIEPFLIVEIKSKDEICCPLSFLFNKNMQKVEFSFYIGYEGQIIQSIPLEDNSYNYEKVVRDVETVLYNKVIEVSYKKNSKIIKTKYIYKEYNCGIVKDKEYVALNTFFPFRIGMKKYINEYKPWL